MKNHKIYTYRASSNASKRHWIANTIWSNGTIDFPFLSYIKYSIRLLCMESLINLRYYYNTVQVHSDMPLYHNMRVCHLDFGGFHYKVKKKSLEFGGGRNKRTSWLVSLVSFQTSTDKFNLIPPHPKCTNHMTELAYNQYDMKEACLLLLASLLKENVTTNEHFRDTLNSADSLSL